MKQNLRPIQFPIDPAKAHLYVARNGEAIKEIIDNRVIYSNRSSRKIDHNTGEVFLGYYSDYALDLTHEIIPEPEAQGLDWSGVVDSLENLWVNGEYSQENFSRSVLSILQQFERECIQTTPVCIPDNAQSIQTCCSGCKTEIDMLIEQIMVGDNNKLIDYVRNNFPEQYAELTKPKKRKVEFWVNVYPNYMELYPDKEGAEQYRGPNHSACLHFEREFFEGEGL